ncbi:hypothetical protein [Prosthecomicrobium sp. N25]|uniref:hypothetical protein n=1 Tax=Prosthecomicrobium sp. N25 TaxID=3129254 RepID=UPI003077BC93
MKTVIGAGAIAALLALGLGPALAQSDTGPKRPPAADMKPTTPGATGAGRSDTAPGQNRPAANDATMPGKSESAPGRNRPPADDPLRPGKSESAPGQNRL